MQHRATSPHGGPANPARLGGARRAPCLRAFRQATRRPPALPSSEARAAAADRPEPWPTAHLSLGHQCRSSLCQFSSSDAGQMTRCGLAALWRTRQGLVGAGAPPPPPAATCAAACAAATAPRQAERSACCSSPSDTMVCAVLPRPICGARAARRGEQQEGAVRDDEKLLLLLARRSGECRIAAGSMEQRVSNRAGTLRLPRARGCARHARSTATQAATRRVPHLVRQDGAAHAAAAGQDLRARAQRHTNARLRPPAASLRLLSSRWHHSPSRSQASQTRPGSGAQSSVREPRARQST